MKGYNIIQYNRIKYKTSLCTEKIMDLLETNSRKSNFKIIITVPHCTPYNWIFPLPNVDVIVFHAMPCHTALIFFFIVGDATLWHDCYPPIAMKMKHWIKYPYGWISISAWSPGKRWRTSTSTNPFIPSLATSCNATLCSILFFN